MKSWVLVLTCLLCVTLAQENLISNPGFERGCTSPPCIVQAGSTISDSWIVDQTVTVIQHEEKNLRVNLGTHGSLYQHIDTYAGETYLVTFELGKSRATDASITVKADGNPHLQIVVVDDFGTHTTQAYLLHAAAPVTKLSFTSTSALGEPIIDSINTFRLDQSCAELQNPSFEQPLCRNSQCTSVPYEWVSDNVTLMQSTNSIMGDQKVLLTGKYLKQNFRAMSGHELFVLFSATSDKGSSLQVRGGETSSLLKIPQGIDSKFHVASFYSSNGKQELAFERVGEEPILLNDVRIYCRALPTIFVSTATAQETEGELIFEASLSSPSIEQVSANYEVIGAAWKKSGTLQFAPGEKKLNIMIPFQDDSIPESTEKVIFRLSNAKYANIVAAESYGFIFDDETPVQAKRVAPALTVSIANVTEGETFTVVLTLSGPAFGSSIQYATSTFTASAADFTAISGTFTFNNGDTTGSFSIATTQDSLFENDESLLVIFSNPIGMTLATTTYVISILNDDPRPSLSFHSDFPFAEGQFSNFIFNLSAASGLACSLTISTVDGTASRLDYGTVSNLPISLNAGVVSAVVQLQTFEDTTDEYDETFSMTISNPINCDFAVTSVQNTILDNDPAPTADITPTAVTVSESSGNTTFSVLLSARSEKNIFVDWLAVSQTASASTDLISSTATLFIYNTTSTTFNVTVNDDSLNEADEYLIISLANAVDVTPASNSNVTFTITDNDPTLPTCAIAAVQNSYYETDSQAAFTVTLSTISGRDITVIFTQSEGSATEDLDYTFSNTSQVIPAGSATLTLYVPIISDAADENDETFSGVLESADFCTITTSTSQVTVRDAIRVSLSGSSVVLENGTSISLTVSLDAASTQTITVDYATADGNTTAGVDYTSASGTLTFSPGQTSKTITVAILNDIIVENAETFTVNLSNPSNAILITSSHTVTISDDDVMVNITISGGGTVAETVTTVGMSVTLSSASTSTVTVNYATANGTAKSGTDYVATSGALTFSPGQVTKFFSVPILNDTTDEDDQSFTVVLSSPTGNAILGSPSQATITIVDDDPLPNLTIRVTSNTTEGNSYGISYAVSPASDKQITFKVEVVSGTATAGLDLQATNTTFQITSGIISGVLGPSTVNDAIDEDDEYFLVYITSVVNAVLTGASNFTMVILDNDNPPTINITSSATVSESTANADCTARLAIASGKNISFDYTTTPATATAGSDYTSQSGTLTISAGSTIKSVLIPILQDLLDEADETFNVTISNAINATLSSSTQCVVTISDDDPTPSVSLVIASSVQEGDSITGSVVLSTASGRQTSVVVATGDLTATSPADYIAMSQNFTFEIGETTQNFTVATVEDGLDEPDEWFSVSLSNLTALSVGTPSSVNVAILDNDPQPTVSISGGGTFSESAGTVTLTLSLDAASAQIVTVDYATSDATAIDGSDYTAASGTITFDAGETSKTFTVSITSDALDEVDETFSVIISNPSNAVLGTASQTVSISDDDPAPTVSISGGGSVAESSGTASLTVSLSTASAKTITVDYATAAGTATAGSDYTTASGTLTFTPGQTTKAVSVTLNDDVIVESDETFTVTISNPSNVILGTASQAVTITDSDVLPTVSISGVGSIAESVGAVSLTVALNQAYSDIVTVDYATIAGTTTVGSDYTAASGTVTFAIGETSKTISITIMDDTMDENDETFSVTLSNPSNAVLGTSSQIVTITDDDAAPTVSISGGGSVLENGTSITLAVSLDAASGKTVTVDYVTTAGTAASDVDYTSASSVLTFNAGETSKSITIAIIDDLITENAETFTVNLSNPSNAILITSSQTVTIIDDDVIVTITTVASLNVSEATGTARILVTLNSATTTNVTVNYATANGLAKAGSDYTAASGTLTFTPGQVAKNISILIMNDNADEDDQDFLVGLSSPSRNAILGFPNQTTIFIIDNDPLPIMTVSVSPNVTESAQYSVTINTSPVSDKTVLATLTFVSGTAQVGVDVLGLSQTYSLAPTFVLFLGAIDDTLDEDDEYFIVMVTSVVNANYSGPTNFTVVVLDNDNPPTINITSSTTVSESSASGACNVLLSTLSGKDISFDYVTTPATATAGSDYTPQSGTLTISANSSTKAVSIPILHDTLDEEDETFNITISNAINATLTSSTQCVVTISDDDPTPSVSLVIANSLQEGDSITGSVVLSTASGRQTSVIVSTADLTATSPSDYIAISQTLTFASGETTQNFTVGTVEDNLDEPDKTFSVSLSSLSFLVAGSPISTTLTILDDDPQPTVSISGGGTFSESAGTVTLTLSLDAASGQTVTVDYATADGTTTAGSDYTAASGTITFNAGETSKTFSVSISDDAIDENDETFSVTLSNPSNAAAGTSSQTVTITDNDPAPTVSISGGGSFAENVGTVTLTVSLGAVSGKAISVDYSTADGTAVDGSDYVSVSGTLNFAAGETSKTFTVSITSDALDEVDETFTVTISNPSNTILGTASQTVTISNDDPAPTVSISGGGTVAESSGTASLTVSLSTASAKTITVDYATAAGTATAGSDYTTASGTLTFTPGQTTKTVSVTLNDDSTVESDETFTVTISNPSNAVLGTASQTVTITDSDVLPTVSISGGGSIAESVGAVSLTVALNQAYSDIVTVDYATVAGTATVGSDYTATSGTVTFAIGETSKTISITIMDDTTDENDETFNVTLSNPSNAALGTTISQIVTITDDDAAPTVSISGGGTVAENGVSVSLTVSLDAASAKTVTVNYATTDGTAAAGSDYAAASGTLTFTAGQTSKTVTVSITDDSLDEADETFAVAISSPSNAVLGTSSQTVTITDNDAAPTVSITASNSVAENAGTVTFTVSLDAASGQTLTVDYASADGTAAAGSDYTAASGTLTFTAGQTSKTFNVAITDDSLDESAETFSVTLSNPSNVVLGTSSKTVSITDNDPSPSVSITASNSVAENAGTVTFAVSLDAASGQTVTVDYATSDGTAAAGSDYTATSGTVTFNAGETSKTFTVSISEDTTDEADETFSVTLSNPSNAALGTSSKTVTITDNDPAPTVSISGGTSKAENAGTVSLTVSLDAASGKTVTVNYATADGTATAGSDYTAASGTLTFTAGQTSKTVTVSITSDAIDEVDETFSVIISNPSNAVLGTASQTVTISDDDPAPTVSISGGGSVAESSGTASLTVSLSTASAKTITVDYATAAGTATAGSDYTTASGTLTFTPGQTTKTVSVTLNDDSTVESNEDFTVTISNPSNVILGTASQTVTITDSDVLPTVSISGGGSIAENGDIIGLTVALNQAYSAVVTVDYATSAGTATSGTDYAAASGTVSFAVGETSKIVNITITDDTTDENDETFTVTLSNPSNAVLGTSTKTLTITDDDAAPTVSISGGGAVAESDGSISLTVSLDAASAKTATVNYATSSGTATAGSDFTSASGTLTFSPGQTSKTVTISITADGRDENDGETFTVVLSSPSNCILGTGSQTVSITDSDPAPKVQIASDQTVTELTSTVVLTLTLNTASNLAATIDLALGGTATQGADYTVSSTSVTFSPGQTSKTVTVTIIADAATESDETAVFTLTSPVNCGVGRVSIATITIQDPAALPGCDDTCSFDEDGCSLPGGVDTGFEVTSTYGGVSWEVRNCGDRDDLQYAPDLPDAFYTISVKAYDSNGNQISPFRFSRFNPLVVTFPKSNTSSNLGLVMISNGEKIWRDATSTCGLQPVVTLTSITFYICHLTTFSLISTQPDRDPLLEWSFQFFCGPQTDPIISGFFTEIHGLQNRNEWECEKFTAVNGREVTSCLPSQLVTAPIVVKRALSLDDQFWNWRDIVANGKLSEARQNCTVLLFDRSYVTAREFNFFNAWPTSVEIETIRTMQPIGGKPEWTPGTQAAMEVITIIHEGFGNAEEPSFSILSP